MEKYSVLMSLYSKENPEYLRQSIQSMVDQTEKPDEILIVKDGPITDELQYVLNDFQSQYGQLFTIVGYEKNQGLGYALNFGLDKVRNKIVARMDTDDISFPSRCEQQLKFFENDSKIDIVGSDIQEFIDNQDNVVSKRNVPTDDAQIKTYLKKRCPLNHVSVMFRKNAVLKAGGYKDLFWNEDYYLWIRMAQNDCVIANTGNVLVNVRVGKDMYKRRGGIKYYKSEKFLQKYMLKNKMIDYGTYLTNCTKRFIVQVLMPNWLRGYIFKKFARSKVK